MQKKYRLFITALGLSLLSTSEAAVNLNFEYSLITGDTSATFSGSYDNIPNSGRTFTSFGLGSGLIETGFLFNYFAGAEETVFASSGTVLPWANAPDTTPVSGIYAPDQQIGFGEWSFFSNSSNDTLVVPFGYQAGDPLSPVTMIWEDDSLADLGFVNGNINDSGSFIIGGETFNWSTAVVPEPSYYGTLVGGLLLLFAASRRRRS